MMHLQKPMLGTQLDWDNPLNRGLVMHLALNEGHGDRVQDLSLNGNHGKLNGFAFPRTHESGWNPGKDSVALNFDGVNDYVNCGNVNLNITITNKMTVEMWVYPISATSGFNTLITKGGGAGFSIRTYNPGGVVPIDFAEIGGIRHYADMPPEFLQINEWQHIVGLYDAPYIIGYRNGNFVKQENRGSYTLNTVSTDLTMGGPSPLGSFNAKIDQVRILNRAYTPAEVLERYMNPYGVYLEE